MRYVTIVMIHRPTVKGHSHARARAYVCSVNGPYIGLRLYTVYIFMHPPIE